MICAVRSFVLTNATAKCVLPVINSARRELREPSFRNRTTFSCQGSTMSAEGGGAEAKLAAIPDVEIDPDGKFKYILIRCHGPGDVSKDIVRGFAWAEFHADIYDRVAPGIEALGFDCECIGGGRIQHSRSQRTILVFGYSMGPFCERCNVERKGPGERGCYGKVKPVLDELQIKSEVLGGGKITHESAEKKIHVYGKSTGFGQADHSITVEKLKKQFPDYSSITFNNEGY